MRQLEIDSSVTLAHILNELKNSEEGLELNAVPGEKTLLDNSFNRAIIEKTATFYKREVVLPAESIDSAPTVETVESDDLGFVEGEDVLTKLPMQEVPKMIEPVAHDAAAVKVAGKRKFNLKLPVLLKNKFVLAAVAAVVIFLILGLTMFFLPTAKVTLTLEAKDVEETVALVGDPKATEVNDEAAIIPMQIQEVTKDGSDEAPATGKKTIGNAAKGRITITNQDTTTSKNFLAGTTITPVATGSAVTFRLDAAVTVDKAPGFGTNATAGVNVTANKVGPESNLPANTNFKVGTSNETLVYAKNDLAFSGGSTKEATVITASDREALKEKIVDKLTAEASDELESKTQGSLVPEEGFLTTVVSETYEPKAVDAEAEKVKATLTIKTSVSLITNEDLTRIIAMKVEKEEDKFKLDKDSAEIETKVVERPTDGTIKLESKVKAKLIPEFDKEEIKTNLVGKNLTAVERYLEDLENISGYEVTTSPGIFRFLRFMPFVKDKITVEFAT